MFLNEFGGQIWMLNHCWLGYSPAEQAFQEKKLTKFCKITPTLKLKF